jgi:exo-beta-1,3-glucanase (GH17 family)
MKFMKFALGALVASVAMVAAGWWWLGRPVDMPAVAAGTKIPCVSYAPFAADQTPLRDDTHVTAAQIEADLAQLSKITACVRTYSIEHGVDQVPAIAQKYGLKVLQGIWLSRLPEKNRWQIDTAIALAKRYPDVIGAVIVGNEVLLRGELSAVQLGDFIREVKAAVPVPVTYADVWEFWLRNRDLVNAVDFVTVHILPYWEDFPIAADKAAAHTDQIRREVAASFPGKDILIGEFGWPSAGRMREGALPSPSNQARIIQEVLALAARQNYRVNIIEAYDQPWKRLLEGTVGGHWGLIPADRSAPKFLLGAPVSDHPLWRWQAIGGAVMAGAVVVAAILRRRSGTWWVWAGVGALATVAGLMVPWTAELVVLESLGIGGWTRWLALAAVATASPLVAAMGLTGGDRIPAFSGVVGNEVERCRGGIAWALGIVAVAATLLAIQSALGLVFDPRYRDFPFAPLTAAIVPLAAVSLMAPAGPGRIGVAERMAAAVLAIASVYIAINESYANWQALWLSALLLLLAVTLWRLRDGQS